MKLSKLIEELQDAYDKYGGEIDCGIIEKGFSEGT